MGKDAEDWIRNGYEKIQESTCPFCLRSYSEAPEIIKAYSQYFQKEYIALKKAITSYKIDIEKINLNYIISEIDKIVTINNELLDFWKKYAKDGLEYPEIEIPKNQILENFENLKKLIIDKSSAPINSLDTSILSKFIKTIEETNSKISFYNSMINNYNEKINEIKSIKSKNLNVLEDELAILKIKKDRFSVKAKELCEDNKEMNHKLESLKDRNIVKKDHLYKYTQDIFKKNLEKINFYLSRFAPYIKIINMESKYKGSSKEPYVEYALSVCDNKIDFVDNNIGPCVKYCLSEGDKSALAFSFFLANLETAGNLKNKIIIFDDPISSFDVNRKNASIFHLCKLSSEARQLIVMTHNIVFAREYWEKMNTNCLCIKIDENCDSSYIDYFDMESESLTGLFKDFDTLDKYLANGANNDSVRRNIARCIRPVIEGFLRINVTSNSI